MQNFNFYNPTRIIFGRGVEDQVGTEVSKYAKKILLHYGGGSIKNTGLYDKIIKSLSETGVSFIELSGVVPNPRLSLVQRGIDLCRKHNIDFILAVGGGSVIDSAKAIAIGVPYHGDVWDFYSGKSKISKALPIGVVLTIPAAGSESSSGSVITKEEGLLKRSCGSELMYPKFALMNPEYTYTLPAYQTACGASDILAHLMERYFTQEKNVDLSDRLIEASMRTIINNAPLAIKNPDNYNYRAEVMWVGTVAHNGSLDPGRIGDWASHGIEHELSAIYDIAHGAGLSIIFPAWMKYVYKENIDKFVQFAMRVFDVEYSIDKKEEMVLEGIRRLEEFYKLIGMPVRFSDAGIEESRIEEMAYKATNGDSYTLGNFKKLNMNDIVNIYNLAK